MDAPDTIPTRWSLIKRLKDWDDQESWREFFEMYWRLIYNTAIRAGLRDVEAQEVVQETVITVAKQMKRFQADPARGSFKGWLLHTTRWKISDQFAKRQAAPAREQRSSANGTATAAANAERPPWTAFLIQPGRLWRRCGTRNGSSTCGRPRSGA